MSIKVAMATKISIDLKSITAEATSHLVSLGRSGPNVMHDICGFVYVGLQLFFVEMAITGFDRLIIGKSSFKRLNR